MTIIEARFGDTITGIIRKSLDFARKHNQKVRFYFNGIRLDVNKRLSPQHVLRTYIHAYNARSLKMGLASFSYIGKSGRVHGFI